MVRFSCVGSAKMMRRVRVLAGVAVVGGALMGGCKPEDNSNYDPRIDGIVGHVLPTPDLSTPCLRHHDSAHSGAHRIRSLVNPVEIVQPAYQIAFFDVGSQFNEGFPYAGARRWDVVFQVGCFDQARRRRSRGPRWSTRSRSASRRPGS